MSCLWNHFIAIFFYGHAVVSEVELPIAVPVGRSKPMGLAQGSDVTVGMINPKQHSFTEKVKQRQTYVL